MKRNKKKVVKEEEMNGQVMSVTFSLLGISLFGIRKEFFEGGEGGCYFWHFFGSNLKKSNNIWWKLHENRGEGVGYGYILRFFEKI